LTPMSMGCRLNPVCGCHRVWLGAGRSRTRRTVPSRVRVASRLLIALTGSYSQARLALCQAAVDAGIAGGDELTCERTIHVGRSPAACDSSP
jgi:hypothetical protein